MNRDYQTRMTNDEIRRTKPAIAQLGAFGHSGSDLFRHSSFNGLCRSGSWSQCALKQRRGFPLALAPDAIYSPLGVGTYIDPRLVFAAS